VGCCLVECLDRGLPEKTCKGRLQNVGKSHATSAVDLDLGVVVAKLMLSGALFSVSLFSILKLGPKNSIRKGAISMFPPFLKGYF
jgi:hypothetical protein